MENKHKLSINQWAIEDRPREKMMEKGAAALSDAELLAILIGSGNTEESAVELMRRLLLSCDNNLNSLAKWEVCDYSRFKGMGPAKSITVMAALELGKRRKLQNTKERLRISCSKDIYDIFQPVMCDLEQEEFWVLLLNQATRLIDKVRISTGGIDGTYTDVRPILDRSISAWAYSWSWARWLRPQDFGESHGPALHPSAPREAWCGCGGHWHQKAAAHIRDAHGYGPPLLIGDTYAGCPDW